MTCSITIFISTPTTIRGCARDLLMVIKTQSLLHPTPMRDRNEETNNASGSCNNNNNNNEPKPQPHKSMKRLWKPITIIIVIALCGLEDIRTMLSRSPVSRLTSTNPSIASVGKDIQEQPTEDEQLQEPFQPQDTSTRDDDDDDEQQQQQQQQLAIVPTEIPNDESNNNDSHNTTTSTTMIGSKSTARAKCTSGNDYLSVAKGGHWVLRPNKTIV